MATLKEFLLGTDFKKKTTVDPGQKDFLQQIWSMLQQGGQGQQGGQLGEGYGQSLDELMQLLDPSSEGQQRFADPYMRDFNQQTVPGLSERFAGGGAMGGGLSSSGFGQALSSAGAGLQTDLASLKSQLQQQAIQGIMGQYGNMAKMGLGTQTFRYQDPQQGFIPEMIGKGIDAAPAYAQMAGGGGMGMNNSSIGGRR